jgi:uncharacterized membrane protein (UPF0127 family)
MNRLARRIATTTALTLTPLALAMCRGETRNDDTNYDHVMSFDTTRMRLARTNDTLALHVELAVKPEQQSMGLMERRRLASNAGMLFVYDSTQAPDASFWMYRTRIPLDIAFADSAGVIRSIRSMAPCPTDLPQACPNYRPDVPYRYALEVNAGYFARHRIVVGNTLVLSDLPSPGTRKP